MHTYTCIQVHAVCVHAVDLLHEDFVHHHRERTRGGGEQHRGEGPKDAVGSPDELRLSLGIQPVDIELTHPGNIPYLKRVCM